MEIIIKLYQGFLPQENVQNSFPSPVFMEKI